MRRRKKTMDDGGVDLGVIITPMLDMAFQLLAFFIMTYHPQASEAAIDGTLLPASPGGQAVVPTVQVIARASHQGNLQSIFLQRPKTEAELIAGAGVNFEAALQSLAKSLAASQARDEEKDLPLTIEADRMLSYGDFIAIEDVARAAGFKKIEFRTPQY